MNTKEINKGIELLRIIFTFMICIQHVLNETKMLVDCSTLFEYYWYSAIKILCYSAVGGYAIISGLVNTTKKLILKR